MNIKQESVLLTVKDVVKFAQVGRSFVYQEVAAGRFPKPVKLGRSVRWLKSEVLAWVEGKALNREAYTEGKEILDGAHESDINEGGPAFPFSDVMPGMSLRDYFAAKAMQAHEASRWASYYTATQNGDDFSPFNVLNESDLADMAYDVADEMLKAREAK
jgi:prophage regulatory protein